MGVVLVIPAGRMANRMIQRIAAETFKNQLKMKRVYSQSFPEWEKRSSLGYGVFRQKLQMQAKFLPNSIEIASGNAFKHQSNRRISLLLVGNMLNLDILTKSEMFARSYFPANKRCSCCGQRKNINLQNFNVVHVRLGDIWNGDPKTSVSYFPLELDFYQSIAELCPKPFAILAEVGTAEQNNYVNRIKRIQPGSIVIKPGCALSDFQLLRNAVTLTLSTSTYSWLASWLSEKNKELFIPNAGLFNPEIRPDINLIPTQKDLNVEVIPATRYFRTKES